MSTRPRGRFSFTSHWSVESSRRAVLPVMGLHATQYRSSDEGAERGRMLTRCTEVGADPVPKPVPEIWRRVREEPLALARKHGETMRVVSLMKTAGYEGHR
jgi:hypothetical protein